MIRHCIASQIVEKTQAKINDATNKDTDKFRKITAKIMADNLKTIVDFDLIKQIVDTTQITPSEASLEFYTSAITAYNWYDEFEEGSCMGLLIYVKTDKLTEVGIKKNYSVSNVSTIFYSASDYINRLNELATTNSDYCQINHQVIVSGTIVGQNNCLIPLYINKHHWKISQIYLKPLIAISVSHNPLCFIPKSLNVVYNVLSHMCWSLVKDAHANNQTYIATFIALYRTAAQVSFDAQYNRGITKYIASYLRDHDKIRENIVPIVGQCLSINYDNNNLVCLLYYFIKQEVIAFNKIPSVLHKKRTQSEIEEEITHILSGLEHNITALETVIATLLCQQVMDVFIRENYTSYSKFMKELEVTSTTLPENMIEKLRTTLDTHRKGIMYLDGKMRLENLKVVCPNIRLNSLMYIIISNRLSIPLDKQKDPATVTKDDIYKLFHDD